MTFISALNPTDAERVPESIPNLPTFPFDRFFLFVFNQFWTLSSHTYKWIYSPSTHPPKHLIPILNILYLLYTRWQPIKQKIIRYIIIILVWLPFLSTSLHFSHIQQIYHCSCFCFHWSLSGISWLDVGKWHLTFSTREENKAIQWYHEEL